mmetsp:Transcript_563/g.1404  ORF Transcript_563/g.1404 Transcript_563/m.1404 type:complete len:229 (-) Transcript_563:963-1649(-)
MMPIKPVRTSSIFPCIRTIFVGIGFFSNRMPSTLALADNGNRDFHSLSPQTSFMTMASIKADHRDRPGRLTVTQPRPLRVGDLSFAAPRLRNTRMMATGWGKTSADKSRRNSRPQDSQEGRGGGFRRGRDREDEDGFSRSSRGRFSRGGDRPMNRRDDFRRDGSRQPISREELYERQREQQAKQAERKSWVEELNEEFPASDFVFGVSPVLAAFRAKRRTIHRLYIQV